MRLWIWILVQYVRLRVRMNPAGGSVWLGTPQMTIKVLDRLVRKK